MKYSLAAAWLTLTLSAPFTAAVADEIYRWVDADGVVNYTQRKPAGGTNVEQVETLTGSTNVVEPDVLAPQAESDDATAAPELTDAQRQMLDDLEQAERERQQEVVKIRAENCEKARDVLEKLTQRSRIRVVSEDGSVRIIPEEERQERIGDAQEAIATNCA